MRGYDVGTLRKRRRGAQGLEPPDADCERAVTRGDCDIAAHERNVAFTFQCRKNIVSVASNSARSADAGHARSEL